MTSYFHEKLKQQSEADLIDMITNPENYDPQAVLAAQSILDHQEEVADEPQQLADAQKLTLKNKPRFRYIRSFFQMILRPDTHRIRTTTKNRLLLTLRFYFLTLLFVIVVSIPLTILQWLGISISAQQIDLIPDAYVRSSDIFFASLLIPMMAGFLEESQFRLVLGRFNKRYFDVFIACSLGYVMSKIAGRYLLTFSEFYSGLLVQSILIYLLFAVPIYFSLEGTNAHSSWFEKNWQHVFKYFFYTLAVLFAMLHLPTLQITGNQLLFWPLLILPFLVYGLVFSYVRIRVGFLYAVLLHFSVDFIILLFRH